MVGKHHDPAQWCFELKRKRDPAAGRVPELLTRYYCLSGLCTARCSLKTVSRTSGFANRLITPAEASKHWVWFLLVCRSG